MTSSEASSAALLSSRNSAMLFLRLYSQLELSQETIPEQERQDLINRMGPLRNKLVHHGDLDESEWTLVDSTITELVDYLHLVERSSLGSDQAQTNRLLSTPVEINDVLRRSPIDSGRPDAAPTPKTTVGGLHNALVGMAIRGDQQAVYELLAVIGPLVVRYCRARLVGPGPSPDDVAQETYAEVLQALPSYREENGSFLAFVYGITARKVADARRASVSSSDVPADPKSKTRTELAMNDKSLEEVVRALRTLPDRQREIIVLRVAVGLTAEETATAIGSTPGAVRVAQHRALARLREKLQQLE